MVSTMTPLGKVKIVGYGYQLQPRQRLLELQEGRKISTYLIPLLSTWSIVAFKTGSLDGSGYGNYFLESTRHGCGQQFVLESSARIATSKLKSQHKVQEGQSSQEGQFEDELQVQLPIGIVRIVPLNFKVPEGWRILQIQQGKKYKKQINFLLTQWSIVAFETGKLQGEGFGNNFHLTYGPECTRKFIISILEHKKVQSQNVIE